MDQLIMKKDGAMDIKKSNNSNSIWDYVYHVYKSVGIDCIVGFVISVFGSGPV